MGQEQDRAEEDPAPHADQSRHEADHGADDECRGEGKRAGGLDPTFGLVHEKAIRGHEQNDAEADLIDGGIKFDEAADDGSRNRGNI